MESRWFNCSCFDAHHAVRVIYDPEYNDVLFEMRVNNYKSIWKRIRAAFKYILNIDNKDCSYDTFMLSQEDRDIILFTISKMKKDSK